LKITTKTIQKYKPYILIGTILVIFMVGSISLQTSYAVGSVWDADVEVKSVGWDGTLYDRAGLTDYETNSRASAVVDPDGEPNMDIISMDSSGLDPSIEWSVSSLFHVDKYGVPTTDTKPKDDYTEEDIRYLVYYFGFSFSMITRSSHPDISTPIGDFDYFGQDLIRIYEYPECASVQVSGEAGIKIANIWGDVPSECGVEQITSLRTRTTYTMAAANGYPSDISEFNYDYDWETFSKEGYINDPTNTFTYPGFSQPFQGVAMIETTMRPGSEWNPTIDMWGTWYGGNFNIWDVEIIVDMKAKLIINYELSADVNGYLAERLDIGWPEDPIITDFFAMFLQFMMGIFASIGALLGFDNPFIGIIIVIGVIVAVIIAYKALKTGAHLHPVGRLLGF